MGQTLVNIPYYDIPGGLGVFCLQNYSIKRNNSLQKKVSFASTYCMHKLHIKYMYCEKGKTLNKFPVHGDIL